MNPVYNPLTHGKDETQGIVGIETDNDKVELFIQDSNGNIKSEIKQHFYWLLSNEKLDNSFHRLEGDLHYKYARVYRNKEQLYKDRRIWKNKDTFYIANSEEACMIRDGYTYYKGLQPKDVSLVSFDIETTGLDPFAPDAKILLISAKYRNKNKETTFLFSYDEYENEEEMLKHFFHFIKTYNPSLIIGHNIIVFDFPYIQGRCDELGIDFNIGRDGSNVQFAQYESKFRLDGTRDLMYKKVSIYGREIVDTYFLSVSFDVSKSIETYALKPMIKQLGLEKEGRQYYDAALIRTKYLIPEEWEKIRQYAQDDAEDPIKLWDMMGPLYFHLAPMVPKPFTEILLTASGSKINSMMIRSYLQDKHSIPKADEVKPFAGAISFAVPGIYKNCFKIDLAALYPSIMIEYKVYDHDKDPKGHLLALVKIFREKRLEYKRLAAETRDKLWQEMDTTAKSILNSFYGFFGAPGLAFNSMACAEFITGKGREILEYTIKWATGNELSKYWTQKEIKEELEDETKSS